MFEPPSPAKKRKRKKRPPPKTKKKKQNKTKMNKKNPTLTCVHIPTTKEKNNWEKTHAQKNREKKICIIVYSPFYFHSYWKLSPLPVVQSNIFLVIYMYNIFCPKMLAKEVVEDSFLPFMTQEVPNVETHGEPISQKVFMC